jgi:hypothetical protein
VSEDYERINDLLDYLVDHDYDDFRDGYLEYRALGTNGRGEYYYNVSFQRSGKKLQSWVVTINEDDEIDG